MLSRMNMADSPKKPMCVFVRTIQMSYICVRQRPIYMCDTHVQAFAVYVYNTCVSHMYVGLVYNTCVSHMYVGRVCYIYTRQRPVYMCNTLLYIYITKSIQAFAVYKYICYIYVKQRPITKAKACIHVYTCVIHICYIYVKQRPIHMYYVLYVQVPRRIAHTI